MEWNEAQLQYGLWLESHLGLEYRGPVWDKCWRVHDVSCCARWWI